MKRMDRSFQWLKKNVSNKQQLRKESAKAIHESSMLAALSRVIGAGRYDSADDSKYKAHAEEFAKTAASSAAAARADDATALGESLVRVEKQCTACHADFRF
jgi:cytochrome c556